MELRSRRSPVQRRRERNRSDEAMTFLFADVHRRGRGRPGRAGRPGGQRARPVREEIREMVRARALPSGARGGIRLRAATTGAHDALRGGARQRRDALRRDGRERGRASSLRARRARRVPRLRPSLSRLCASEVRRVQRASARGLLVPRPRILPIVHGSQDGARFMMRHLAMCSECRA